MQLWQRQHGGGGDSKFKGYGRGDGAKEGRDNMEAEKTAMAKAEAAEATWMQREGDSHSGGKGGHNCVGKRQRQWQEQWWQGQG